MPDPAQIQVLMQVSSPPLGYPAIQKAAASKIKLELKELKKKLQPKKSSQDGDLVDWAQSKQSAADLKIRSVSSAVRLSIKSLLDVDFLADLSRKGKLQVVETAANSKPSCARERVALYEPPQPAIQPFLLTDSPEAALAVRQKRIAELPARICAEVVNTESTAESEQRGLALGRAGLRQIIDQLQKSRSVVVRKRQLARVGDLRWSSVKEHLKRRAAKEHAKNLSSRPVEARVAIQMIVKMIEEAQDAGPEQVAMAVRVAMGPLRSLMTELPSLLKRDAPYRQSGTELFDRVEDFFCRVFQGDVRLPTAGRAGLLADVGSMLIQLGLARERAGLLVRLCHTILRSKRDDGQESLQSLRLDTLGIQSLVQLAAPPEPAGAAATKKTPVGEDLKVWGRLEAKSSVCRNGHVVHITRDSKDAKSRPAAVGRSAPLTRLVQVAASAYRHCLAIDERGRVIGWGDATKGALGPSKAKSIGVPTPLSLPIRSSVVDVGCGSAFSAAVTADGKLWAWGHVNLMKGTTGIAQVKLPADARARSVRCGFNFTLATLDTPSGKNVLFGFGKNNKGQLGVGDTKDSAVLQPVGFQDPVSVTSFACGWFHALASDVRGRLYAWGGSQQGNKPVCGLGYGDGKDTPQLAPQRVSAVTAKVTQVVCGHDHSACLDANGGVWVWGSNGSGQLGNGERGVDRAAPQLLTPALIPAARQIAAGRSHTAAVSKSGALYAWGQLDTSWGAGQRDAPRLLCAERCTAASCYLHGDVLALSQSSRLRAPLLGADGVPEELPSTSSWLESGMEPFRPRHHKAMYAYQVTHEKGNTVLLDVKSYPPRSPIVFEPVVESGIVEFDIQVQARGPSLTLQFGIVAAQEVLHHKVDWSQLHGFCCSRTGDVFALGKRQEMKWIESSRAVRPGFRATLRVDMEKSEAYISTSYISTTDAKGLSFKDSSFKDSSFNSSSLKASSLKGSSFTPHSDQGPKLIFKNFPKKIRFVIEDLRIGTSLLIRARSVERGLGSSLQRGRTVYTPLWEPSAAQKVLEHAKGDHESAHDAVYSILSSVARICARQRYPEQSPSILGVSKLLFEPLCIDAEGPEMLEQLVDLAVSISDTFTSTAPATPGGEERAYLLQCILRVLRANIHRMLLSGVDQRWAQVTSPATPDTCPWRGFAGADDAKTGLGDVENEHFLRRLHRVLIGLVVGRYRLPKGAEEPLGNEAARIVALALELLYPETGERLALFGFILDQKSQAHPFVRALKAPVLQMFQSDRFCTLLIPEPVRVPRRLRTSGEEFGVGEADQANIDRDKARFTAEVAALQAILLRVVEICEAQCRASIAEIGSAAPGGSTIPGTYVLMSGVTLSVHEDEPLESREVARIKPLSRVSVAETRVLSGGSLVRGRITDPVRGWITLYDVEANAYWAEGLPTPEMQLFYALHRHVLTWADAYTKVLGERDQIVLPEAKLDVDVTVGLASGEMCEIRMNRRDRIASIKDRLLEYMPPNSSTMRMELYRGAVKLADDQTLEEAGVKSGERLTQRAIKVPTLRRTLSAFKPRSHEQAKASLFAARAVEAGLRLYTERVIKGCCALCADVKAVVQSGAARGSAASVRAFHAMDTLRQFLGTVGGSVILSSLGAQSASKALPNVLQLSQASVEELNNAITPLLSVCTPQIPRPGAQGDTILAGRHAGLDRNSLVIFDQKELAPHVQVSGGGLVVSKISGPSARWNTIRLSQWMPKNSGVYKFDFRIKSNMSNWVFVGCVSEQYNMYKNTTKSYLGCSNGSWGYSNSGNVASTGRKLYGRNQFYGPGSKVHVTFKSGDTVTVAVDTDKNTIGFFVNGKFMCTGFRSMQYQKLAAAVTLYSVGDSVAFEPHDEQLGGSVLPQIEAKSWRIRARALPGDTSAAWNLSRVALVVASEFVGSESSDGSAAAVFDVVTGKASGSLALTGFCELVKRPDGSFESGIYGMDFKRAVSVTCIKLQNAGGRAIRHFDLEFKDAKGAWHTAQRFDKTRYISVWDKMRVAVCAVDEYAPDRWDRMSSKLQRVGDAGVTFKTRSSRHTWASALAGKKVMKGKHEWRVLVKRFEEPSLDAMIGVAQESFSRLDGYLEPRRGCYSYMASGRRTDKSKGDVPFGRRWKTGDVITVCLDMDEGTLRFMHNGESRGISHRNLPKGTYRLAVALGNHSTVLEVLPPGKRPDPQPMDGKSTPVAAGPRLSELERLPWSPPRWLATLHGLLFSSFCEVLVQTLAVTPTDPTTRLAALRKLKQTFDGVASSRKRHEDAKVRAWADEVKGDDAKAVSRALRECKVDLLPRAAVTALGQHSPDLARKVKALRADAGASRTALMQTGLMRTLLRAVEGGMLRGFAERGARELGSELRGLMASVTSFLSGGGVGAGERFMALKIWTSLMSKRFLDVNEMKKAGVVRILQDTMRGAVLPGPCAGAKALLQSSSSGDVKQGPDGGIRGADEGGGGIDRARDRVMFESTALKVYHLYAATVARDEAALREAGIVEFVLSELLRLSPTVVADGKRKLSMQKQKQTNLRTLTQSRDQLKFESQLVQLTHMGFVDMGKNLNALKAANGNLQGAVDKLLSGKPIIVPKATGNGAVPKAKLPLWIDSVPASSPGSGAGGAGPCLSLWVDASKLNLSEYGDTVIAYRGIQNSAAKSSFSASSMHHRWYPRIHMSRAGHDRCRVYATLSTMGMGPKKGYHPAQKATIQSRVGGMKTYALRGTMHIAFTLEAKQMSLFVNGVVDQKMYANYKPWVPDNSLELQWGPGVSGYEAPWYAIENQTVRWINSGGIRDFNVHYASILLGMLDIVPQRLLVREKKRPKRPNSVRELLAAAGLTAYEQKLRDAGYDDFSWLVSLDEAELQEFYKVVQMPPADRAKYSGFIKAAIHPRPSKLANFVAMLLAGSPDVQLAIVRLLSRLLRSVPPADFDAVFEHKGDDGSGGGSGGGGGGGGDGGTGGDDPPGTRTVEILCGLVSNTLWAPYDPSIIPQNSLPSSVPVAGEIVMLLRRVLTETRGLDEAKAHHGPAIEQWARAIKSYLRNGLSSLDELVRRLRPLTGQGGTWDESVMYAGSMRRALEAVYVLCGSSICGVELESLQASITDFYYYYYGLSPFGKTIAQQLERGDSLVAGGGEAWSLGDEVAGVLGDVGRFIAMYGTVREDGTPPYTALEFNLMRLWLLTGVTPRVVRFKEAFDQFKKHEAKKSSARFKEAFDQFKKHEAKKSSASRAARRGGPWKAGTGYGSGNTSKDSARIRKLKLEHEAREAKRRTEIVSIARAVNAQLSAPVLDSAFVQALSESSVLPWLASVFKQTSALEMQKEARLVSAAIDITEAMASRDELTPLFLPRDGETQSLQKVLADQRASAEMMLKFTKGGLDVRVKELLARLVGASKAVAAAVRAHRRRQQGAPPIFPRDGKKAATGPPRKMVSGTAYKSEMYGLVDEKQYMELLRSSLFVEMPDFKRHHYRKGPCKSSVVSAAWTTRLGAELVGLSKSLPLNPNSSVFFRCCAKDMSKAKMIIAAPPSTPYGYGLFLFDVYFPPTYPSVPPKVNLMTTGHASVRFNPNLYNNGKVCLSLLGTWSGSPEEMWQPNQSTFLQVCVSIQSLIFIENPYFNEPGYEKSMNTATGKLKSRQYNSIREVATVQWAMLDMLKNPPPGFEDAVRAHFFLQQKNICAQIEAWLELPEHRNGQLKSYYVQLQKELAKLKEPSAPADDLDEDDDEDDDDF